MCPMEISFIKWDSLFRKIRNRVCLFVYYSFRRSPNKRTHYRILRNEPIKSASNTAAGGVQRLGVTNGTQG
jgi:hypothetical protein